MPIFNNLFCVFVMKQPLLESTCFFGNVSFPLNLLELHIYLYSWYWVINLKVIYFSFRIKYNLQFTCVGRKGRTNIIKLITMHRMLLQTSVEWNLKFLGPESEVRGGVRVHCQQREQNTVSSSEGFEDNEMFQNHWNLPKTHMDLCTKHELYDLSEVAFRCTVCIIY